MGFDSINGFNFKIAGGGGEWAISRESYRMGTNLDYARLMSFYQSAVRGSCTQCVYACVCF